MLQVFGAINTSHHASYNFWLGGDSVFSDSQSFWKSLSAQRRNFPLIKGTFALLFYFSSTTLNMPFKISQSQRLMTVIGISLIFFATEISGKSASLNTLSSITD